MTKDTKEDHVEKGRSGVLVIHGKERMTKDRRDTEMDMLSQVYYLTGLKQNFVVMTKSPGRQNYKSFDTTKEENSDRTHWVDQKYQEGLLIPTCSKIQLMTKFKF